MYKFFHNFTARCYAIAREYAMAIWFVCPSVRLALKSLIKTAKHHHGNNAT